MAFPANASDIEVCVAYGANLASDLTTLTYSPNLALTHVQPRVTITRGRIGGASRTQPTTIDFGLKNPQGVFSPRNIVGPHYGQLRRNTPVRVRLDPGTGMVTRAIAYMPDWPTRWTGPDIDDRIPMQASGALRRLGTGQESKSALKRSILATSPIAYWPLEDSRDSVSGASALPRGTELTTRLDWTNYSGSPGTVAFGSSLYPVGSSGAVDMSGGGSLTGGTGLSLGVATTWEIELCIGWATLPTGVPFVAWPVALCATYGGSYALMGIGLMDSAGSKLLAIYDDDGLGGVSASSTALATVVAGRVYHVRARFDQIAGNIWRNLWVDGVQIPAAVRIGKTLGQPTGVQVNRPMAFPVAGVQSTSQSQSVSHVAVWAPARSAATTPANLVETQPPTTYAAAPGYSAELAATRVARLCTEEGIAYNVTAGATEPMGPQLAGGIVDVLRECEDSDEATLIERRTGVLGFDPRSSRYNKSVVMTVNYVTQVADLLPADDDRDLRNYITANRIGGSSGTVQRTTGPLGTDKTTGVDRYPDQVSRSLATDPRAVHHAGWLTNIGTVDEPRYVVDINLRAHPELVTQWLACDIGSRILINNPPAIQVGPAPLDLVIEGYQELIDGVEWYVTLYALPYRPYEVYQIETGTGNRSRIAAGVSTTDLAYSASATSLLVVSPVVKWIDSAAYAAKFPIAVEVAGEVMTCTAIANYLNANPYFETPLNASSWTAQNGATIAANGAQFHEGAQSLLITPDGTSFAPQALSEEMPATALRSYTLSGWLRSASSGTRKLGLFWYDASHTFISANELSQVLAPGVWTQYGPTTYTAPGSAVFMRIASNDPGAPIASNTWRLDEITVTNANTQVFTVARGLHGIAKPLPITSQVQIWRAPCIAL